MITQKDRSRLIQDSLLGLTTWLRELDAFLYPVTDSLLLYFHRPLVISFWRIDGDRPELSFRSSLSRPEILDQSTAAFVAKYGTIQEMPYAVLVEENTPHGLGPLDTETTQAAQLLTLSTFEKRPSAEVSLFRRMLLAALERANPATLSEKLRDLVPEVQEEGADPVEDSLRALFNSVLNVRAPIEGAREAELSYPDEPSNVAALFSRRRILAPSHGIGLGARILLFKGDKRPFSPTNVPEIWNCITLGTIAIQGPGPGKDWSGLDALFSIRRRGYCLLVPIHVGGVPWAVLVRRGLRPGQPDWLDSYHFYREVVPRLATALRMGAKQVYLDTLGRTLISELERRPTAGGGSEFVKQVNDRWRQLAERLPFELPRLRLRSDEEEREESSDLRLPSGRRLAIEIGEGFFKPILQYDPLVPGDLVEACRRSVDEFARTESSIQLRSVATASHALRLPVDELRRLADRIEPSSLREAISLRLGRLKALETFSNYLYKRRDRTWESRSIKLADLVSWIEQRVSEILALHADPDLGEQTWRVAGRLLATGQVRADVDENLALDVLVDWFPEQAEVAIDGLLANAIKFNDLNQPGLALWVGAGGTDETKCLFLKVANRAARSPEHLVDLVRSLNQGADPRYVGVSLLAMASEACRLLPPRWAIDHQNRMAVTLQIGRLA